jgi:hypothetical protein
MDYFHWQCNDKIFFNKPLVINENISSGKPILFKAPDAYNKVDCSQEPTDDWETILCRRAQELKDSYKKIRLWYSGGSDSHKVLMTFIKNGIYIDEIVIKKKVPNITTGDVETLKVAIPVIQSLQHLIPKTNIKILESTVKDYESFYNTSYWWETLIRPAEPGFVTAGCTEIGLCSAQFDPYAENNCINIITRDKPYIVHINNKWYAYWIDNNVQLINEVYQDSVSSFYIDDPQVHLKQCHMLKKYIEDTFAPTQYNSAVGYNSIKSQTNWNIGCGRIKSNKRIKIPKIWIAGDDLHKNIKIAGTNREFYQNCYKKKEITRISEFLDNGLEHIVKRWADTVLELSQFANGKCWNNGRAEDGYLGVLSDFYCLNDGSVHSVDDLFPNGFDKSKLP